jgi:periplasmic protein TonB
VTVFTPDWYDSAHEQLKLRYPRYTFIATMLALVITGLSMVYSPPYIPAPYQLRERKVVAVNTQTEVFVPVMPSRVDAPDMPIQEVEATDDADAVETIGITDFNPFAPPEIPTAVMTRPEDFVAYDSAPVLVHSEAAEYPDLARQAEVEGTVTVVVTIDVTGRVVDARVQDSDTITALEQAALEAARKFLFEPAKQRDVPVQCQILIPFSFSL